MASIVKRGKSYSVVYYQGTGKRRQQVWESGLSYSTAKSRKTQIEHEQATNTITTVDSKDMTCLLYTSSACKKRRRIKSHNSEPL